MPSRLELENRRHPGDKKLPAAFLQIVLTRLESMAAGNFETETRNLRGISLHSPLPLLGQVQSFDGGWKTPRQKLGDMQNLMLTSRLQLLAQPTMLHLVLTNFLSAMPRAARAMNAASSSLVVKAIIASNLFQLGHWLALG